MLTRRALDLDSAGNSVRSSTGLSGEVEVRTVPSEPVTEQHRPARSLGVPPDLAARSRCRDRLALWAGVSRGAAGLTAGAAFQWGCRQQGDPHSSPIPPRLSRGEAWTARCRLLGRPHAPGRADSNAALKAQPHVVPTLNLPLGQASPSIAADRRIEVDARRSGASVGADHDTGGHGEGSPCAAQPCCNVRLPRLHALDSTTSLTGSIVSRTSAGDT